MKRTLLLVGLLLGLGTGVAAAQVGVSLSFGDPHFHGQVVVGRPYYHRYARPHYHRYSAAPVIVVAPRRYYAPRRVVVVRPHRHFRGHRHW